MSELKTVIVGGITTVVLSRSELTELMVRECLQARDGQERPKLVFDLNGHGVAMAHTNAAFRAELDKADIVHADGQPIVLASRLLTSTPIRERTATTDFFHDAAEAAQDLGLRFYLLGGSEAVNAACMSKMRSLYPRLEIVGRRHGYFAAADEAEICAEINASGADLVWIGLGKPHEQAFCTRNAHRLTAGWLVTCGGCFNYVTGHYGRAPHWMQAMGLEWLFRAASEPRKFAWRYLSTNPIALYYLMTRTRSHARTADGRA